MLFVSNANAEKIIITHDGIMSYTGKINRTNFELLKRIYDDAKIKPKILEITSTGGNLMVGIDMGNWVLSNKLSVRIEKYCLSACANYIFPAGNMKIIDKKALLLWHGGANQSNLFEQFSNSLSGNHLDRDYESSVKLVQPLSFDKKAPCIFSRFASLTLEHKKIQAQEIDACISYMKQKEMDFYKVLGVDPNLPIYGQSADCKSSQNKDSKGFYYSIEDMKKMGIRDIHIDGRSWDPQLNRLFLELKAFVVKPTLLGACSNE